MRRVLVVGLLLVSVVAFAQVDTIHYRDNAVLAWDAITEDINGEPLLPDDTVEYDVYIYDYYSPPADIQDPAQLVYVGRTGLTEQQIDFSTLGRSAYAAGVRAVGIDGQGTVTYTDIAWSTDPVATDPTAPFLYVPLSGVFILPVPTGLRDSGI